MKFLKINDEAHKKLKDYCKEKPFFMQDWVEYIIDENIKNNFINMYEEYAKNLEGFITIKKADKKIVDIMYLDSVETEKLKPKKPREEFIIFKLDGTGIKSIKDHLKNYDDGDFLNIPGKNNVTDPKVMPSTKEGVIRFISFSRIDGLPMFIGYKLRCRIAENKDSIFDPNMNTFGETETLADVFERLPTNELQIGGLIESNVSLVSALEDHIVSSFSRYINDDEFIGTIEMKPVTKRIQLGTSDDENLKEIIVDEIIREYTEKANLNVNTLISNGDATKQMFEFSFDEAIENSTMVETEDIIIRKLMTKIKGASGLLATNGKIGPATCVIMPSEIASKLSSSPYTLVQKTIAFEEEKPYVYPVGVLAGITVYATDKIDDIIVYRNNTLDQPGVKFIYNFDNCGLNELNYAITDLGFSSHKQYVSIKINKDINDTKLSNILEDRLRKYDFINLNSEILPYGLETHEISVSNIKNINNTNIGIDVNGKIEKIIVNEIQQYILKEILVKIVDGCKINTKIGLESMDMMGLSPADYKIIMDEFSVFSADYFIVTNVAIGSELSDLMRFTPQTDVNLNYIGIYPIGYYDDENYNFKAKFYIDPYMSWNDNRIIMFDNATELSYNKNIISDIIDEDNTDMANKKIIKSDYKLDLPENFKIKIIDLRKEV